MPPRQARPVFFKSPCPSEKAGTFRLRKIDNQSQWKERSYLPRHLIVRLFKIRRLIENLILYKTTYLQIFLWFLFNGKIKKIDVARAKIQEYFEILRLFGLWIFRSDTYSGSVFDALSNGVFEVEKQCHWRSEILKFRENFRTFGTLRFSDTYESHFELKRSSSWRAQSPLSNGVLEKEIRTRSWMWREKKGYCMNNFLTSETNESYENSPHSSKQASSELIFLSNIEVT